VTLPDRPGALGQVARTLGVAGADIVQVVVLERQAGRAVDDFTLMWPGASRVERLVNDLSALPGVQVEGVWRANGAPAIGGDVELLARVAANPADGLAILVDTVPGLLAADWAVAAVVPADWAVRNGATPRPARLEPVPVLSLDAPTDGAGPAVTYASWRAPDPLRVPEVTPLRPRALTGPDGTRYAVVPFGRAGLVLIVARADTGELSAPDFHSSEVERAAQLVRAAAAILGDRLDLVIAAPAGVPTVSASS